MKKIKNKNKLVSFKSVDKNGNGFSLIMIALSIILVLSLISIFLGVKAFLSEERSTTLDFGNAHFISDTGIIKDEIILETGSELPEIKDYFINSYDIPAKTTIKYSDAYQMFKVEDFTIVKDDKRYVKGVQDFYVLISYDGIEYESILRIVDTVKPEVTFKDVIITIDDDIDIEADSFIESYSDNSLVKDYTATIKNNISTNVLGTSDLIIEVCDLGGNCIKNVSKLTVNDNKLIDDSEDEENKESEAN